MKKLTRAGLIHKLDRLFSRYIRKKYANHGGWVECVTCGKSMPWEDSQAGHFVKRGHHAVRWDERNVHPQCPQCNLYKNGAQDDYTVYIVREYGEATLRELLELKYVEKRYTMAELRDLVEQYREQQ